MAFETVNDYVGSDELVYTVLLFSADLRPRVSSDPATPYTFKRAAALRSAAETMSR